MISPTADVQPIEFRKVGSEDLTAQARGAEAYTTTVEYELQNTNFLKYGTQAQGGGTQTPDRSLTLLTSIRLNNTENFLIFRGTRINSVKIAGKAGESHKASAELFSNAITAASTGTDLGGTVNYTSDPGTAPWTFSTGGSSPVRVDGLTVPCTEIETTINRNLERIWTLESTKIQYLPPKHREITGSLTLVWVTSGNYVDLTAFNSKTGMWVLGGSSSINYGNMYFNKLDSMTLKPDNVVYEKYSFTANTVSVAN